MRILHVVPSYVPAYRYGGPIVAVHGLCRALAALGHEVSVYTTTADGPRELDVEPGRLRDVDGVAVTYFRCDGPRRLYWAEGLRRALARHVGEFDIVHAHSCYLLPPTWAARAAHRRSIPYVFSPRGMLVSELIRRRNALLKRVWIRLFDARTLRRAAVVHVTSEVERDELLAVVADVRRFAVIANGVDVESVGTRLCPAESGLRVLYLGRISWKKGLDLVLRALAAVPGATFQIVGNDEEGLRPHLERLATELDVASRVHWAGPRYGADKDAALKAADVLVLASLSENFGNAVLEAMAAGLPVVCTPDVGAAALVQAAGCGLVVERSPEALAGALQALAADETLRRRMGEAGQVAAAAHSWASKAAEMEAAYLRCLDRPGQATLADQPS